MPNAEEPVPDELPEGLEDSDAEGAPAAAKKKKKSKKKKGGGKDTEASEATEAVETAEATKAGPSEPAAATSAPTQDAAASSEESEEEAGEAAAEATKKKKKRKPKKKAPAETEAAAASADGQDAGEAAESGEEEEEEAAQDAAAPAKKKKRKAKKKAATGAQAANTSGAVAIQSTADAIPEEEFTAWVKKALEATANCSDQMSSQDLMKPPQAFWGFKYSGNLRAAFVTPQMRMPEGWLMPDYATDPGGVCMSERTGPKEVPILESKELETMRQACRLGREVLDIAARFMRPGVTGDQIDRVVYQACVDRKIYPSPLNYYRFPKSVCVSPNEVICHGIPDCRPIEEGDIVNLDVSIFHEGFHSDLNETFFVGECDEDSHRLVRTAYNALLAASEQIRPGTFYRDLGNYIHAEAVKNGCSVVTTYCGHGIGRLFHGPPKVPHYRKNKAVGIMKPGHVFTVEPMINLGGNNGDRTWPDNWTAVTKDGKRSAQFEHTFLVTETGLEVLTRRHGTDPSRMPAFDPAMFQV